MQIPPGGSASADALKIQYKHKLLRSDCLQKYSEDLKNNKDTITENFKGQLNLFLTSLTLTHENGCNKLVQIHALQNIKNVINELGYIVNKDNETTLFNATLYNLMNSDGTNSTLGINYKAFFTPENLKDLSILLTNTSDISALFNKQTRHQAAIIKHIDNQINTLMSEYQNNKRSAYACKIATDEVCTALRTDDDLHKYELSLAILRAIEFIKYGTSLGFLNKHDFPLWNEQRSSQISTKVRNTVREIFNQIVKGDHALSDVLHTVVFNSSSASVPWYSGVTTEKKKFVNDIILQCKENILNHDTQARTRLDQASQPAVSDEAITPLIQQQTPSIEQQSVSVDSPGISSSQDKTQLQNNKLSTVDATKPKEVSLNHKQLQFLLNINARVRADHTVNTATSYEVFSEAEDIQYHEDTINPTPNTFAQFLSEIKITEGADDNGYPIKLISAEDHDEVVKILKYISTLKTKQINSYLDKLTVDSIDKIYACELEPKEVGKFWQAYRNHVISVQHLLNMDSSAMLSLINNQTTDGKKYLSVIGEYLNTFFINENGVQYDKLKAACATLSKTQQDNLLICLSNPYCSRLLISPCEEIIDNINSGSDALNSTPDEAPAAELTTTTTSATTVVTSIQNEQLKSDDDKFMDKIINSMQTKDIKQAFKHLLGDYTIHDRMHADANRGTLDTNVYVEGNPKPILSTKVTERSNSWQIIGSLSPLQQLVYTLLRDQTYTNTIAGIIPCSAIVREKGWLPVLARAKMDLNIYFLSDNKVKLSYNMSTPIMDEEGSSIRYNIDYSVDLLIDIAKLANDVEFQAITFDPRHSQLLESSQQFSNCKKMIADIITLEAAQLTSVSYSVAGGVPSIGSGYFQDVCTKGSDSELSSELQKVSNYAEPIIHDLINSLTNDSVKRLLSFAHKEGLDPTKYTSNKFWACVFKSFALLKYLLTSNPQKHLNQINSILTYVFNRPDIYTQLKMRNCFDTLDRKPTENLDTCLKNPKLGLQPQTLTQVKAQYNEIHRLLVDSPAAFKAFLTNMPIHEFHDKENGKIIKNINYHDRTKIENVLAEISLLKDKEISKFVDTLTENLIDRLMFVYNKAQGAVVNKTLKFWTIAEKSIGYTKYLLNIIPNKAHNFIFKPQNIPYQILNENLQHLFVDDLGTFKLFYKNLSGFQLKNLHKLLSDSKLINIMDTTLYQQLKSVMQPTFEDLEPGDEIKSKIVSYTNIYGLHNLLVDKNIQSDKSGIKFFNDSKAETVRQVLNLISSEYTDKTSMLNFIDNQKLNHVHIDQLLFWRNQAKDYAPNSQRDLFWNELENSQTYVKYLLAASTDLSKNCAYLTEDTNTKNIPLETATKLEQVLGRLEEKEKLIPSDSELAFADQERLVRLEKENILIFFNSLFPLQVKQLVEFLHNAPVFKYKKELATKIEQYLKIKSAAYFQMVLENPQYLHEADKSSLVNTENIIYAAGLNYIQNNSSEIIDAQVNFLNSTQIWNLRLLLDQPEFEQAINDNTKYSGLMGIINLDNIFKDKSELALNILKGDCPPQHNKYAFELIRKVLPLERVDAINKESLRLLGENFHLFTNQHKLLIQYRFKQFSNKNIEFKNSALENIISKQVSPTNDEEEYLYNLCYALDNSDQLSMAITYVMHHTTKTGQIKIRM